MHEPLTSLPELHAALAQAGWRVEAREHGDLVVYLPSDGVLYPLALRWPAGKPSLLLQVTLTEVRPTELVSCLRLVNDLNTYLDQPALVLVDGLVRYRRSLTAQDLSLTRLTHALSHAVAAAQAATEALREAYPDEAPADLPAEETPWWSSEASP